MIYLWISVNGVRMVMENLEKSWNFKTVISRSGEVMEKFFSIKVFEKSWKFVIITSFMRV